MKKPSGTKMFRRVWSAAKRFMAGKRWWIIGMVVGVALVVLLGWLLTTGRIETGFEEYVPSAQGAERAKTLWDWLDLLLVPMLLAIGAWLLNRAAAAREHVVEERRLRDQRDIELDRGREAALQTYLDRVTLLLRDRWRESGNSFLEANIIRAQTLTVLSHLDGVRKGSVVCFLYESGLIGNVRHLEERQGSLIDLHGADLFEVALTGADLNGVDLSEAYLLKAHLVNAKMHMARLQKAMLAQSSLLDADLIAADLTEANLIGARLCGARLCEANLSMAILEQADLKLADMSRANLLQASLAGADLRETEMRGANLSMANLITAKLDGANLDEVDLSGANLTGANVSDEQLAQVKTLQGATLPNGRKHAAPAPRTEGQFTEPEQPSDLSLAAGEQ